MPTPARLPIVALVSALTFAFGATPVAAAPATTDYAELAQPSTAVAQRLSAQYSAETDSSLDALTQLSDRANIPHGFDVDAAIAQAKSELGTSRATGWGQPGECIVSAKRWLTAGGAAWTGSGDPLRNYEGATRLTVDEIQPGDIVQYENIDFPSSWVTGVHTVLVIGVNGDGTYAIIESNNPTGSGLVSENDAWSPAPPAGFRAVVWRF